MSQKTGLVSITLPQQTYAVFSAYCKSKGFPVRRMMDLIVKEAIKRDLYTDIVLSVSRADRINELREQMLEMIANGVPIPQGPNNRDEIDDLMDGVVSGASTEAEHCYSGMVADYHRQYLDDITPVTSSGVTGVHVLEQHDVDLEDLLSDTD
jgi:hypothetical protein